MLKCKIGRNSFFAKSLFFWSECNKFFPSQRLLHIIVYILYFYITRNIITKCTFCWRTFRRKRIYVSRFFYQTSIWICLLKYPTNEYNFLPCDTLICLLKYPMHEATLVIKLIKRSRAKSDFITYLRDPIEVTTTSWILQLQLFWDLSATASTYFHLPMDV